MKIPRVLIALRNVILAVLFFLFVGNAFAFDGVKEGSIITFGRYPQTASGEIKPIEWRVLEVKDNKAFLLADKGLDVIPYNTERRKVTWKTSSIRQWLNSVFYNEAFNNYEKSRIAITVLKNPDNEKWGTEGGGDTRDRIFLLSLDEAEWYLMYNAERVLVATPYAENKGVNHNGNYNSSCWLLRSQGLYQDQVSGVEWTGALYMVGTYVNDNDVVVRPALWVNL